MSRRYKSLIIRLILFFVLLLLAIGAQKIYFSDFEYLYLTRRFNRILHAREKVMEDCLNGMRPILAHTGHHGSTSENDLFSVAMKNDITILEFLDNQLAYWSNNDFDVPSSLADKTYRKPLVFLQNGWFLLKTVEAGNEKLVGLLRIRTEYNLQNSIIKTGFEKAFHLPANVGLRMSENSSRFHIYDKNGQFLFNLVFPQIRENTAFILIPVSIWLAVFILILMILAEVTRLLSSAGMKITAVGFAFAFFTAFYLLLLWKGVPGVFLRTEMFSPLRFSFDEVMPSLGHLLIFSILGVYFAVLFYRYVPMKIKTNSSQGHIFAILCFIAASVLLCLYHFIFSNLISNSNINFEPYKVLDLSWYTLAGFLSSLLLLLIPGLFLFKILRNLSEFKFLRILAYFLPSLVVPFILFHSEKTILPFLLFYIILTLSLLLAVKMYAGSFSLTVIFSLVFGIYSLYFIIILSEDKITGNLKTQAVAFSTENDPEAEQLLIDIGPQISHDTLLISMMKATTFNKTREDVDNISAYLQMRYFSGYWSNYNFNIVLSRNDEPLRINEGNEVYENTFDFFDNLVRRNGHRLTGTDFYFIDNQGARSYYLGKLFYKSEIPGFTNGLFIELYSDINVFQPGYSALLLDKKFHGFSSLKDYSFAKYINGDLVLSTGDFPYNKTDADYIVKVQDYRIFNGDKFKHVLYKNGNATILISRPRTTAGDLIISFAYLFVFILLFSNLFLFITRRHSFRIKPVLNFRQKLQVSFVAILLFSFILIGIVVAYLTITQYRTKHYENIKEKLNSVYLELDNKLSMEKQLNRRWSNSEFSSLNDLLISLSNSFNTDINLYDITGYLVATSRPEIFNRNLTSRRIDNMALINLANLKKSEYYQKEKIGNLEYLSAYMPFFNSDNVLLAYLNLPYFRMQSVLAREISNLIVAVVNFTLLLIVITMSLAVVISRRLTSPLSMLGDGLARVAVGKKIEHLDYRGNDEIAELVRQYNRMVDEIEDSGKKLADSEREYAWREMARQIAHEIKNPLTPMKLNVQQLFKSWKDKEKGFGERIEHFTKNQIEYIDNLSSIASAFSSFAKLPGTHPSDVDLLDQIRITLELFRNEAVTINVSWPGESKVIVYADKEHLNGIFSNLIKNSIQSIPPGKAGVIDVDIVIKKDKALISIADNGSGIPENLQKKLFTPNFTTKSSGMGLGLSIVKKYVETANGRIWFDSEPGNGTTFFIEMPLKYTVEKSHEDPR